MAGQLAVTLTANVTEFIKNLGVAQDVAKDTAQQIVSDNRNVASSINSLSAEGRRFVASLKEEAETFGKSREEMQRYRAAQLGVSSQAEEYIAKSAKLRAEHSSINGVIGGTTAEANRLKWALQGVPAQFTDIAVSLAGGQNPMMVFMQQGGQLRDMFGSAGQAAKALGNYVVGLVTPYNVFRAAAMAVATAWALGQKEAQEYAKALAMTGNAAGVTAGNLAEMARTVSSGGGGTQGAAADALTQLVTTGKVTGETLSIAADAALRLKKYAGVAIEDTVKAMADLGKSPYDAAKKLDDQYNVFTATTLKQIKALEEQGRNLDAAKLAQESYASEMKSRSKEIEESLGNLEKAWLGVAGMAKSAWDSMLNIGRKDDLEKKLQEAKDDLKSGFYLGSEQQKRQEIAVLEVAVAAQKNKNEAIAKENELKDAQKKWNADEDKYLTQHAKVLKDIAKVREEGARAGASQAEIETRVSKIMQGDTEFREAAANAIEAQYKRAQLAAKDAIDNIDSMLKRGQIGEQGALMEKFSANLDLLKSQEEAIRKRMALAGQPPQERAKLEGELNQVTDQQGALRSQYGRDVAELNYKRQQEVVDGWMKTIGPINDKAKALREENDVRGKTILQIENERLARYRLAAETADESAGYEALIAAQEDYVNELAKSRTWEAGAGDAMRDYLESATNSAATAKTAFSNSFKSMEDSLVEFAKTGKLSFGNFVNDIVTGLIRMQIQASITKPLFDSIQAAGGIGGMAAAAGSWISNFFGGGKAIGGPVQSGMMYEVAEGGRPELLSTGGSTYLMMGANSGVVTPASSASAAVAAPSSSGGVQLQIIESPGNGGQVQQSTGQNGQQIIKVLVDSVKGELTTDIRSGGTFATALSQQFGLNRAAGAF